MQAIRIAPAVRAAILTHAREQAPRECCGLLVGSGTTIDESVRSDNLDSDPNRYRLDPAVHIATNRRLRGSGRAVIGVYHSHPHSAPAPSRTDYLEAHYPEFVWLIVSLSVPEAAAVGAFRLADDGFLPIAIE